MRLIIPILEVGETEAPRGEVSGHWDSAPRRTRREIQEQRWIPRARLRVCVSPTWQEGDDPLFGVLLSSLHGKFVQHLHL